MAAHQSALYCLLLTALLSSCQTHAGGDKCWKDDDCYLWGGSYAFCNATNCDCQPDKAYNSSLRRCYLQRNVIGGSCTHRMDCSSIQNSTCTNKTCNCADGVSNPENTTCVPVASTLGSNCDFDVQCSLNLGKMAVCVDKICQCVQSAVNVSHKCYEKKNFSEICRYSEQCQHEGTNMVCQENICTCGSNSVLDPDMKSCVAMLVRLGDACVQDIQCSRAFGDGSRCNKQCVCKNDFRNVNNTACVKKRGLGEKCTSNEDCLDLYCDKGNCTNVPKRLKMKEGIRYAKSLNAPENIPGKGIDETGSSFLLLLVAVTQFLLNGEW